MKRRSFIKGLLLAPMMPIASAVCVPEFSGTRVMTFNDWRYSFKCQNLKRIAHLYERHNSVLEDMDWVEGNE